MGSEARQVLAEADSLREAGKAALSMAQRLGQFDYLHRDITLSLPGTHMGAIDLPIPPRLKAVLIEILTDYAADAAAEAQELEATVRVVRDE